MPSTWLLYPLNPCTYHLKTYRNSTKKQPISLLEKQSKNKEIKSFNLSAQTKLLVLFSTKRILNWLHNGSKPAKYKSGTKLFPSSQQIRSMLSSRIIMLLVISTMIKRKHSRRKPLKVMNQTKQRKLNFSVINLCQTQIKRNEFGPL